MNRLIWIVAALTGVVGFLLGLVAMRSDAPASRDAGLVIPAAVSAPVSTPVVINDAPGPPAAADFAAVAARLNAAVVNVDAAVRGDSGARTNSGWRRDLADDPAMPREGKGSGFIIDPSGYILTNFHVVEGADRLTVTLGDGRTFQASVAGVDPALDVALIKITATGPLPTAVLGDSERLRVGQWVCAIGNPLGYVHSVTVGVVSFLGRKLFDQTLDAYIQTDAAISLGNSGGPLVDAEGRVIGITSAVSSQAASIGFAIPISCVVAVLPQLRERGRVSRGDLGAGLTRVTPALQLALALSVDHGALVQDVPAETPAERAGLRPYDVILSADGVDIRSDEELLRHVAAKAPGTATSLDVLRAGNRHKFIAKLAERPIPASSQRRVQRAEARPAAEREQDPLGLAVRVLDPSSALRRALPESVQGVVVVDVDPAGPARVARLRPGQIVLEVNRQPTLSVAAFHAAVNGIARGGAAAVLVYDPISNQRMLVAIVPDRME